MLFGLSAPEPILVQDTVTALALPLGLRQKLKLATATPKILEHGLGKPTELG